MSTRTVRSGSNTLTRLLYSRLSPRLTPTPTTTLWNGYMHVGLETALNSTFQTKLLMWTLLEICTWMIILSGEITCSCLEQSANDSLPGTRSEALGHQPRSATGSPIWDGFILSCASKAKAVAAPNVLLPLHFSASLSASRPTDETITHMITCSAILLIQHCKSVVLPLIQF